MVAGSKVYYVRMEVKRRQLQFLKIIHLESSINRSERSKANSVHNIAQTGKASSYGLRKHLDECPQCCRIRQVGFDRSVARVRSGNIHVTDRRMQSR